MKKKVHIKNKIILIVTICSTCLVLLILLGYTALKTYRNARNTLASNERDIIPGIICIGDSLTQGTGGIAYTEFLQEDMEKKGYIIPIYNLGVGGENTVTILSRLGALPLTIKSFTIPEGIEPVEITFENAYNGFSVSPLRQGSENNNGINPCHINGIEGLISINQTDYISQEYNYYFTRIEAGCETEVAEGSEVNTYARNAYKDGIFIVFIGTNSGYTDIDDLIEQQKLLLDLQELNQDKYVIIGLTTGTREERSELEETMEQTYGNKYINLRECFTNQKLLEDAGIEMTSQDLAMIEQGIVPECVRSDEVHYNTAGYKLLSEIILGRMIELGYMDEVDPLADEFNSRWGLFHSLEISLR